MLKLYAVPQTQHSPARRSRHHSLKIASPALLVAALLGFSSPFLLPVGDGPAIAAAQAAPLSDGDQSLYQQAFDLATRGQWPSAVSLADQARNPVLRDVLLWRYMQQPDSGYSFETISAFVTTHPGWPAQSALLRRAEDAMSGDESPQTLLRWFASNPPFSAKGKMMLAGALIATGKTEQAIEVVRDAWVNEAFSAKDEQEFLARFSSYLTLAHHQRRASALLWNDHDVSAERMLKLLDPDHRALIQARMALQRQDKTANALVNKVPAALHNDPGLLLDRITFRRKQGQEDEAIELFKAREADSVHPQHWWQERSLLARSYLRRGFVSQAYRLAAGHKMTSGTSYAEAEWLAGWIALRFLKDTDTALKHFKRADAVVTSPISVGRAAYWTGRAAEAGGQKTEAQRWYAKAAEQATSYYGQLAAARLDPGQRPGLPRAPQITDEDRRAFNNSDLTAVVRALGQISQEDQARSFLFRLTEDAPTEGQRALAVMLGTELRPDLAVAMSRRAAQKGTHVLDVAYPLPASLQITDNSPEKALVLSVIRQESNFNSRAISGAGAQGLMQLLPATAQHVAKKQGIPHATYQLTSDPSHNVQLGSSYLEGLINGFQGSYIMAVAGYNAGPGRPKNWVQEFGDPRQGEIDPIDWVEMIPFTETRNYVQRVLESVAVYRARLSKSEIRYTLEQDLKRGG